MKLAVCMKWVDSRPDIDPLTGDVVEDRRWFGASRADQTALETALSIRDLASQGSDVTAICAGPPVAETLLREALAAGADRAVRVDLDPTMDASAVASSVVAAVASVLSGVDLVVCGDWSLDRGTGSFPAFLAHELGVAQALGCTKVVSADHVVEAERRIDGGRRERVVLSGRAVVSVEAGKELRRAGLREVLAAADATIDVVPGPASVSPVHHMISSGPFRPRSRELTAPADDDPRVRLMEVAGVTFEPTASQARRLDPGAAAEHVLDQLGEWGIAPAGESTSGPDGGRSR